MTLAAIRPAKADDVEALMRLRLSYLESQLAFGLLDGLSDMAAYVHDTTLGLLTTSRARVLVAEFNTEIAGYAVASFRVVPGARQPSVCLIDEVFVYPQGRGAGLARQMVACLLEEAGLRKANRVQIRVLSGNPKARILWEQLGFVENVIIMEYTGSTPTQGAETPLGESG